MNENKEQKNSPLEKGEVFNPSEEVQNILRLPKEERRVKLSLYKEKLVFQRAGLEKVQAEMIDEIRKNPDMSFNEMYEMALSKGAEYGMSEKQEEKMRIALENYEVGRRELTEWYERFPDGKDFFFELIGKKPKGEIEVVQGAVAPHIKCHDSEDFAEIYYAGYKRMHPKAVFDDALHKTATLQAGISLSLNGVDFLIIAENVVETLKNEDPEKYSKETYDHEEQHILHSFFEKDLIREKWFENFARESLKKAEDDADRLEILKKYMREVRKEAEQKAKDEILAYYKDNTPFATIHHNLMMTKKEGGPYDYLAAEKNKWQYSLENDEVFKKLYEKAENEVFKEEYEMLLSESLGEIEKMEKAGYAKDEIIALLTHEPLGRWGKVVGRVLA